MDFSLDDFTPSDQPSRCVLTNPVTGVDLTYGGKPVAVLIHGPDSKTMRDHERATQNRRLKAMQATGKINLDAEAIEAELNARVAKSVAGWENFHISGKEVVYSGAMALELVTTLRWLRDQIDGHYGKLGNFLQPGSKPN